MFRFIFSRQRPRRMDMRRAHLLTATLYNTSVRDVDVQCEREREKERGDIIIAGANRHSSRYRLSIQSLADR